MPLVLDHLVVAARDLDQGVAWAGARLGVPFGPGGKHPVMGTHNRLLHLGAGRFLEVIAIDPAAAPITRPRWFSLDTPEMRVRLAQSPALIHWVVRSDDIERDLAAMPGGRPEILVLERGDFRWRIGVPASGMLSQGGIAPTLIQWLSGHPCDVLPDSGCRLASLVLGHDEAPATLRALRHAGLPTEEPVQADAEARGLRARIRTPRGIVEL